MSINKVIFGDETLIDLTSDTVKPSLLMSGVTAHDCTGTSITGTIIARTSSDIEVAGPTVSVPSGAYSAAVSTTIPSATLNTPLTLGASPQITVYDSGLIKARYNAAGWRDVAKVSGYVTKFDQVQISIDTSNTYQLTTQAAATITPTESVQTAAQSGKFLTGNITVGAVSSDYIGSNIAQRSSGDLIASGSIITVPAGYYASQASKPVAAGKYTTSFSGTINPTISVSSTGLVTVVGDRQARIAPVYSSGYVEPFQIQDTTTVNSSYQLNTQAATTISPTESEQTAVAAGKFTTGIVKVGAISSNYVGSNITARSSSDLTVSGATVTAPAGYYSAAAATTIPNGSAKTPATTITSTPGITISATGLITATNNKTQNVTPTVTAGYVSSGTAGTITVSGSNTSQLTTKAAATYTPGTSDQTISANQYLTGAQTVKGDANLIAANIASGVTIFGITGTHQGGITPTGTITISSNGTYDVTNYAAASVNIGATVVEKRLIVPEGMIGV